MMTLIHKANVHTAGLPLVTGLPFLTGLFFLTGCWLFPVTTKAQPAGDPEASQHISFTKHVLTTDFIAEGVAAGDVNRDGKTDILAGAFWFEAPHWQRHELTRPEKFIYNKGYSDSFVSNAMDVNLDGWIDFVRVGFPGKPALWFENPKNKEGHWKAHIIHPTVGNESAGFFDVDGDGRLDLLGSNTDKMQMIWLKAPVSGDTAWTQFTISREQSPGTVRYSHGLGLGDVNNDGRKDVIIKEGWWEAPEDLSEPNWTFHPGNLSAGCSQMYTFDFDGDGDQDVVSSSAHRLGIWWHEQTQDDQGAIEWITHLISDAFTQTHGLDLEDINSDGYPDLVTGKRYFAHMGKDPGAHEPAVLYWFEFKPGKDPAWIPHLIDDDSGVGVQVVARDITGDGLADIIISNKKGVFFFKQE